MVDERFRLRIRYTKGGRLKYLSHLEVVRCLERCIRRADLPFMVSQGFSPHMRTAFGWALPVGVSSEDEYLDVLMYEYLAPARVLDALRPVTPRGIKVLDAFYIDPRAKAPDMEYPYADYTCVFAGEDAGEGDLAARVATALGVVLERGEMLVKRKKKEKVVRFEGLLVGTPELVPNEDGTVTMRMTTFTEGKGSLRPDLFCNEITSADERIKLKSIARTRQRSE